MKSIQYNRRKKGTSPRSSSGKSRPQHLPISRPIHRFLVDEDGSVLMHVSGTDRTGIISHVTGQAQRFDLNILSWDTSRLQERFTGSFFVINGDREQLTGFRRELVRLESEPVSGKQVLPGKLYDVRMKCDDRIGLLHDISRCLTEHDINIVTMGLRTGYDLPSDSDDFDLSDEINNDRLRMRAFLHLRCEVPQEQLPRLPDVEQRLRDIRLTNWVSLREHVYPRDEGRLDLSSFVERN
jgi:predicted amino acid-binding ACT domain protein